MCIDYIFSIYCMYIEYRERETERRKNKWREGRGGEDRRGREGGSCPRSLPKAAERDPGLLSRRTVRRGESVFMAANAPPRVCALCGRQESEDSANVLGEMLGPFYEDGGSAAAAAQLQAEGVTPPFNACPPCPPP